MNCNRNKNIYLNLQNGFEKRAASNEVVLSLADGDMDLRSRKGNFGWDTIGDLHVPYIFRYQDVKYTIFRFVHDKIISQHFRYFNQELFNLFSIMVHSMTDSETKLFNEINIFHSNYYLATRNFTSADKLILLDDVKHLNNFFTFCFDKLIENKENNGPAGYIKFGQDNMVPYMTIDAKKFMPSIYFEGETQLLFKHMSANITGFALTWYKFLMKLQVVQGDFMKDIKIVDFDMVKQYFPADTVYTESFVPISKNCFVRPLNARTNFKAPKMHLIRPAGEIADFTNKGSFQELKIEPMDVTSTSSNGVLTPVTDSLTDSYNASECSYNTPGRSPKYTAGSNKGKENLGESSNSKILDQPKFKIPPPPLVYNRSVAKKKTCGLNSAPKCLETTRVLAEAKDLPRAPKRSISDTIIKPKAPYVPLKHISYPYSPAKILPVREKPSVKPNVQIYRTTTDVVNETKKIPDNCFMRTLMHINHMHSLHPTSYPLLPNECEKQTPITSQMTKLATKKTTAGFRNNDAKYQRPASEIVESRRDNACSGKDNLYLIHKKTSEEKKIHAEGFTGLQE